MVTKKSHLQLRHTLNCLCLTLSLSGVMLYLTLGKIYHAKWSFLQRANVQCVVANHPTITHIHTLILSSHTHQPVTVTFPHDYTTHTLSPSLFHILSSFQFKVFPWPDILWYRWSNNAIDKFSLSLESLTFIN